MDEGQALGTADQGATESATAPPDGVRTRDGRIFVLAFVVFVVIVAVGMLLIRFGGAMKM